MAIKQYRLYVKKTVPDEKIYRYVVNATPYDACISLSSPNALQESNYIVVEDNAPITVAVWRTNYITQKSFQIFHKEEADENGDIIKEITLNRDVVKVIVESSEEDSDISLTCEGCTQEGNSITVPFGSTVSYAVYKEKYTPETGSIVVDSSLIVTEEGTYTKKITLKKPYISITGLNSVDEHTTEITYILDGESKTITTTNSTYGFSCDYGASLEMTMKKSHYLDNTYSNVDVDGDKTIETSWTLETHTFTITATPADSAIELICDGCTQEGNSITVPYNSTVKWTVSKENYNTQSGEEIITEDKTMNISLTQGLTLDIITYPSEADVYYKYLNEDNVVSLIDFDTTNDSENNYEIQNYTGLNTTVTVPSVYKKADVLDDGTKRISLTNEGSIEYIVRSNGYNKSSGTELVESSKTIIVSLSK